MSIKKYNDIIGNRTRDLPACSAVSQPTAPPRTPLIRAALYRLLVLLNYFPFCAVISVWELGAVICIHELNYISRCTKPTAIFATKSVTNTWWVHMRKIRWMRMRYPTVQTFMILWPEFLHVYTYISTTYIKVCSHSSSEVPICRHQVTGCFSSNSVTHSN